MCATNLNSYTRFKFCRVSNGGSITSVGEDVDYTRLMLVTIPTCLDNSSTSHGLHPPANGVNSCDTLIHSVNQPPGGVGGVGREHVSKASSVGALHFEETHRITHKTYDKSYEVGSDDLGFDGGFGTSYFARLFVQVSKNNITAFIPTTVRIKLFIVKSFVNPVDILNSQDVPLSLQPIFIKNKGLFSGIDSYYLSTDETRIRVPDSGAILSDIPVFDHITKSVSNVKAIVVEGGGQRIAIEATNHEISTFSYLPRCLGNLCVDVQTYRRNETRGWYTVDHDGDCFSMLVLAVDGVRAFAKLNSDEAEAARYLTGSEGVNLTHESLPVLGNRHIFWTV